MARLMNEAAMVGMYLIELRVTVSESRYCTVTGGACQPLSDVVRLSSMETL